MMGSYRVDQGFKILMKTRSKVVIQSNITEKKVGR